MIGKKIIILILLSFHFCLQTKKSGFDFKNNPLFGFGFLVWSEASSKYTVGGSLTGFSSGSLILSLNGSDETFSPSSKYTFSQTLSLNASYTVTVRTNPTGYACSVSNASGKIGNSNIVNADIVCLDMTVSPLYSSAGSNWNDYVKNDGADIFSATGTACTGSETGTVTNGSVTYSGYRLCLHGGEFRKVAVSSRSSCTGLTASDSASALNWICRADSSGKVFFYSAGLKKGKYLSDLIDWTTNSWKSIKLTVLEGSTVLMQSNSSVWWSNGFSVNTATAGSTTSLSNTSVGVGTIYIYSSTVTTNDFRFIDDKAAFVIKPGVMLTSAAGGCTASTYFLNTNSRSFLWIEGRIDSSVRETGLYMSYSKFSAVRYFKIQKAGLCGAAGAKGVYFDNSNNNLIESLTISMAGTGIQMTDSSYNIFQDFFIYNSSQSGVYFTAGSGGANENTFINLVAANNNGDGLNILISARNNVFMDVTLVNNSGNGVNLAGGFNNAWFRNISASNNAYGFSAGSSLGSYTIENYAGNSNGPSNNTQSIALTSGTAAFRGVLKADSSAGCTSTATGLGALCVPSSPSEAVSPVFGGAAASAYRYVPNSGSVFTDSVNSTAGLTTWSSIGPAAVTDALMFENPYRGIGRIGSVSFPNPSNRTQCSGTGSPNGCLFNDFSLKSADTLFRNTNTVCPTDANMYSHSFHNRSVTVLRNSVEIIGAGIGNDNGLCEANEDCLLTPNIGAYQGHGNLVSSSTVSGGCSDVTSLGIKLYQYETNGY